MDIAGPKFAAGLIPIAHFRETSRCCRNSWPEAGEQSELWSSQNLHEIVGKNWKIHDQFSKHIKTIIWNDEWAWFNLNLKSLYKIFKKYPRKNTLFGMHHASAWLILSVWMSDQFWQYIFQIQSPKIPYLECIMHQLDSFWILNHFAISVSNTIP